MYISKKGATIFTSVFSGCIGHHPDLSLSPLPAIVHTSATEEDDAQRMRVNEKRMENTSTTTATRHTARRIKGGSRREEKTIDTGTNTNRFTDGAAFRLASDRNTSKNYRQRETERKSAHRCLYVVDGSAYV